MKTVSKNMKCFVLIKELSDVSPLQKLILNGTNYYRKMPIFVTITADFQCRIEPLELNENSKLKTENIFHQNSYL